MLEDAAQAQPEERGHEHEVREVGDHAHFGRDLPDEGQFEDEDDGRNGGDPPWGRRWKRRRGEARLAEGGRHSAEYNLDAGADCPRPVVPATSQPPTAPRVPRALNGTGSAA